MSIFSLFINCLGLIWTLMLVHYRNLAANYSALF